MQEVGRGDKEEARKDGKSLPSGKPEDKCGGKELPPPINGKKGKGKAKNSKPLLRKTFSVDPRPTPRQDYVVAINFDGQPATEEDRWAQMAALAFAMAVQHSSSTQPPIYLRDSRVENGTILPWCDSAASQESILGMLSNQDGITLTPRGGSRRLVFEVPGYMANLPVEMVLHLLERQNPELPQGSLQYVSLHRSGRRLFHFCYHEVHQCDRASKPHHRVGKLAPGQADSLLNHQLDHTINFKG